MTDMWFVVDGTVEPDTPRTTIYHLTKILLSRQVNNHDPSEREVRWRTI